jgi:hypothetical protein
MWAIPYANRLPNITAKLFPKNHNPCLSGCSLRLYHIPVISEKPGEIEASAAPRNARTMTKPAKLEVAAWHVRHIAQTTLYFVCQTG